MIVMFADVFGSATMFERLGDKEAMHAVERCLKRMRRSIDGYGGNTVQIVGDELLASFHVPEDACHAAIDMQMRIADLPPISGLKLAIRIGLHCGEVVQEAGTLVGTTVANTARITGMARREQILCSSALVGVLPPSSLLSVDPMPGLGTVNGERNVPLSLYQVRWPGAAGKDPRPEPAVDAPPSTWGLPNDRLCLRYRGKAFLLDEKTPLLTIGRDLGCKLVVDDRKASRQHARIEKRNDGFYLVDTSTNGSFVAIDGQSEVFVRHDEVSLERSGRICFGSSNNDPAADSTEYEYL